MRRRSIVLAVCVALASQAYGELPFTHFTADSGAVRLPTASVQKIYQDRAGYIWLAFFSSGVARYDGHSMQVYGVADGLTNLTVREMIEDRTGHLWIGSATMLLVSDRPVDGPGRVRFVSRAGRVALQKGQVRRSALAIDGDGWVSIALPGRIQQYRFDAAGTLTERTIPLDISQAVMAPDSGGSLLIATDDGRLARIPRGTTNVEISRDPAYGSRVATTIYVTRGGDLILGTVTGEIWRRRGANTFEPIATVPRERITAIEETADGTLWAATLGSGLLAFPSQGGEPRTYTRRDDLLGETLWCLLVDREGNLWIGQNGGLSRLRSDFHAFDNLRAVSHVGEKPLLTDAGCFGTIPPHSAAAANDPQSWLWVATGGGVTIIDRAGNAQDLHASDGLLSNADYGISRDANGTVWIATAYGLNAVAFGSVPEWPGITARRRVRIFDREATLVSFTPNEVMYRVHSSLTRDGATVTCVAGINGLECLAGDRWLRFGEAAGLSYGYDWTFDDQGFLWVARYDAGVFRSRERMTLEAMRRLAATHARAFDHVEGSTASARGIVPWHGEVWATIAGGVAVFGRGKPVIISGRELGGGEFTGALAPSPEGTMWVSQNEGLVELDRDRRVLRRITTRDGLLAEETWGSGISFDDDGRLFLSTPKGVSIVRPQEIGRNRLPPPVRIERFELHQDRSGQNDVSVEYAALSFANEDNVRYRTRLDGYEHDFSPPVSATSLRYTNLPAWLVPKRYVLEVMAANNNGVWSQPYRFAFTVRPAWWNTWWAWSAFVAALTLAAFAFLRHRTRQLEAHNRELAITVEARTRALRDQAHELDLLDRIVETINRETSLAPLLHALLEQGEKLLPMTEKGAVLVVDHERSEARIEALLGYERADFDDFDLSVDDAMRRFTDPQFAIADGIFLIHEKEYPQLHANAKVRSYVPELLKAMLTMRVGVGERADGFLIFDNYSDGTAFDGVDVEMLARFRQHALSAINKARMLRKVHEANQAKSAFLAKMSHEIRTPLNAILGFVQVMLRDRQRSADDRESLSIIMRSGEHLLGLINDVLSMAKIEAGRVTLNEEVFDCGALLPSLLDSLHTRASAKNIDLTAGVSGFPSAVRGDSGKLRQVLLNLLDNAVKFTPHDGTVALHARWSDGRGSFEILDTGPGMSTNDVKRLFEPFVQTATGFASHEGTGLGLAICRTFVQLMGGEISVDSEPGRGSRFSFDIPLLSAGEMAAKERRRIVALAPGQPLYRFLVADDTEENRLLLDKIFSPIGFEVRCVADGQAAIDVWREWSPQLVWMDIRMPVVDGLGATRAIRAAEGDQRRTVIVALTASAFEHDRERIFAAGCDDFVAKPFLEETLFEKITSHLGAKWTYEELSAAVPALPPPLRTDSIPQAVCDRMIDALTRGDVVAVREINEEVRARDARLAARIAELLKAYRFDDVQALIERPSDLATAEE